MSVYQEDIDVQAAPFQVITEENGFELLQQSDISTERKGFMRDIWKFQKCNFKLSRIWLTIYESIH